jgi:hypothetical protein
VPEDTSFKGVVVANIAAGGLIARSKKLQVGDVLHAVNGQPVATPQQGASLLREAKGVTQLMVTRAKAKTKRYEDEPEEETGRSGSFGKADKTRSFLPSLSMRPKSKKKEEEEAEAPATNTTVVVSCSALIQESKKIVGESAGLDEKLDQLYAQLKAKEVPSQATLQQARAPPRPRPDPPRATERRARPARS